VCRGCGRRGDGGPSLRADRRGGAGGLPLRGTGQGARLCRLGRRADPSVRASRAGQPERRPRGAHLACLRRRDGSLFGV